MLCIVQVGRAEVPCQVHHDATQTANREVTAVPRVASAVQLRIRPSTGAARALGDRAPQRGGGGAIRIPFAGTRMDLCTIGAGRGPSLPRQRHSSCAVPAAPERLLQSPPMSSIRPISSPSLLRPPHLSPLLAMPGLVCSSLGYARRRVGGGLDVSDTFACLLIQVRCFLDV